MALPVPPASPEPEHELDRKPAAEQRCGRLQPISLNPLTVEEALAAALRIRPPRERTPAGRKSDKGRRGESPKGGEAR